jgi:DNA-binding transcriptional ArsR family regulator
VSVVGPLALIGQQLMYGHHMLTVASRVDAMNRLGRAMADPTRSRILLALLQKPGYPAQLARDLELTRTNVSNHLSCLRGCGIVLAEVEGRQTRYQIADPHLTRALEVLVDLVLAVDDGVPCVDADWDVPMCCTSGRPAGTDSAEEARA